MGKALADLTEGKPGAPGARPVSAAAEQALVGGVVALIVRQVDAGEGTRLPELLPDLLQLVLRPYLGHEQALAEARRAGAQCPEP